MAGQAIWFEIPSTQFERAVKFYEAVFSVTLKRENIGGAMAVFSGEGGASGAIVDQQPGYAPSKVGPVVYLDAGTDLTPVHRPCGEGRWQGGAAPDSVATRHGLLRAL